MGWVLLVLCFFRKDGSFLIDGRGLGGLSGEGNNALREKMKIRAKAAYIGKILRKCSNVDAFYYFYGNI